LTNPNLLYQFPHTLLAGLTTAAFFMMGISAYHIFRKIDVDPFERSFRMAAIVGMVASILLVLNGHVQTQHMVQTQPMKMAAAEALWESENPASLSLFTIGDMKNRKDIFSIRIPYLLSLLAYDRLNGKVEGINNLQADFVTKFGSGDYVPPAIVTYWTFRMMVGAGFALVALAVYALYMVIKKMPQQRPLVLRIFILAISLPYLANTSGWILTEVGRFPWVVYGLVKMQDGVSPNVTAGMLLISLIGYVLIYGLLIAATVYLLSKYARAGLEQATRSASEPGNDTPSMLIGPQE
jgi:cytochrome d ubiquinol oxidase subunit I